jgi:ATP-dependent DNA helicase DinG
MEKKAKEILTDTVIDQIKESIQANNGNEVFFIGYVDRESGKVDEVEAVAYGNDAMTPVFLEKAVASDVVIHNHPSGILTPSPQDLQMADILMNQAGVSFLIVENDLSRVKVIFYAPGLSEKERKELDSKTVLSHFEDEGSVSRELPGYELRESQKKMVEKIIESYNRDGIALIEAGTGTGKSLAYLIPSIEWALLNNEKVVVATYTKNLQHQLLEKDLPLLEKILNKPFKYALIKGKGNYLCKKRLQENYKNLQSGSVDLFEEDSEKKLTLYGQVQEWADSTVEGDLEELPPETVRTLGEDIRAATDLCLHRKCPYFDICFVNRAKQKVFTSDLIIANHHFLLGQLSLEYQEIPTRILPKFSRIVIDEAHNFKKAAYSYLEEEASLFGILKQINRIYSLSRKTRAGDLNFLSGILQKEGSDRASEITSVIEEELSPGIPLLKDKVHAFFKPLQSDVETRMGKWDSQYRLKGNVLNQYKHLKPLYLEIVDTVKILEAQIEKIEQKLKRMPEKFQRENELLIRGLSRKITHLLISVDLFQLLFTEIPEDRAVWFRVNPHHGNVSLHQAQLDTSDFFQQTLYRDEYGLVFTSATLSINHNFGNFKAEMSMGNGKEILESILPSPFDYANQSRIFIPSAIPLPAGSDNGTSPFVRSALEITRRMIEVSKGGVFVLCTSFTQIRLLKEHLWETHCPYPLFIQGETNRRDIVTRFRESGNGVLLGTDSFWEGVDIRGEALRTVILFKLPFRPPNDPVTETLYELEEKKRRESLYESCGARGGLEAEAGIRKTDSKQKRPGGSAFSGPAHGSKDLWKNIPGIPAGGKQTGAGAAR